MGRMTRCPGSPVLRPRCRNGARRRWQDDGREHRRRGRGPRAAMEPAPDGRDDHAGTPAANRLDLGRRGNRAGHLGLALREAGQAKGAIDAHQAAAAIFEETDDQDDYTDDNAWWGISWQLAELEAHMRNVRCWAPAAATIALGLGAAGPIMASASSAVPPDSTPIVIHEVPLSFADPLNLHAGQPGGPLAKGRRLPPFRSAREHRSRVREHLQRRSRRGLLRSAIADRRSRQPGGNLMTGCCNRPRGQLSPELLCASSRWTSRSRSTCPRKVLMSGVGDAVTRWLDTAGQRAPGNSTAAGAG
jgi:hypothetical protein